MTLAATGMVWTGGDRPCPHPAEALAATVEGGLTCTHCDALLVPRELLDEEGMTRADQQVKFLVKGRFFGLDITGEFTDLTDAARCLASARKAGVRLRVYKVTMEEK